MGKPQFYPATFDIDISVCMSCQICVEVCPFEAIKMDKVFELSRRERFDALAATEGRALEIKYLLSRHSSGRGSGSGRQSRSSSSQEKASSGDDACGRNTRDTAAANTSDIVSASFEN